MLLLLLLVVGKIYYLLLPLIAQASSVRPLKYPTLGLIDIRPNALSLRIYGAFTSG